MYTLHIKRGGGGREEKAKLGGNSAAVTSQLPEETTFNDMLLGIVGDYFFWIGPRLTGSLHCWHSAAAVFVAISTEYIGIPCGTAP